MILVTRWRDMNGRPYVVSLIILEILSSTSKRWSKMFVGTSGREFLLLIRYPDLCSAILTMSTCRYDGCRSVSRLESFMSPLCDVIL